MIAYFTTTSIYYPLDLACFIVVSFKLNTFLTLGLNKNDEGIIIKRRYLNVYDLNNEKNAII